VVFVGCCGSRGEPAPGNYIFTDLGGFSIIFNRLQENRFPTPASIGKLTKSYWGDDPNCFGKPFFGQIVLAGHPPCFLLVVTVVVFFGGANNQNSVPDCYTGRFQRKKTNETMVCPTCSLGGPTTNEVGGGKPFPFGHHERFLCKPICGQVVKPSLGKLGDHSFRVQTP